MRDWRLHPGCILAPGLRSWLQERGSLTARCSRIGSSFSLRLVDTGNRRSLAATGSPRPEMVRVREVLLECDGLPVIFARTEMPLRCRGDLSVRLKRLGTTSLASLLFSGNPFRRGTTEFLCLDGRHPLHQRLARMDGLSCPANLWARRTGYRLGKQPMLVIEVFLPALNTALTSLRLA